MSAPEPAPLQHAEVRLARGWVYALAFVEAMLAMLLAVWVARDRSLAPGMAMGWIAGIAALTLLVQTVALFDLDLSPARRWHVLALVMVLPLFVLAIGLTLIMFHSLMLRTMLGA